MLFKQGSKGLHVRAIRLSLNTWSGDTMTPLAPDGIFGPLTKSRVRAFQSAYPLSVDGIVGPNTFSYLFTGVQLTTGVQGRTAASPQPLPAPSGPPPQSDQSFPSVGLPDSLSLGS